MQPAVCEVTWALTLQIDVEVRWTEVVQSLSRIYARTREHRQLVSNEGRRPTRRRCQGAPSAPNGRTGADGGMGSEHRVCRNRERGCVRRPVESAPQRMGA